MKKISPLRTTSVVSEATRKTMRANRSKNTGPELTLRRKLWEKGARGYRIHVKTLPGSPDIAFVGRRVAVFVHGCFWHGCPHCNRYREPKTNSLFWRTKLQENRDRDERALSALKDRGFRCIVAWECQIEKELEATAMMIMAIVREGDKGVFENDPAMKVDDDIVGDATD